MSNNGVRNLDPSFSHLRSGFDPARVRFDYNEFSDTLYIYAFSGDQPLISVPLNEGELSLLVDPDSEEVQGFQIDDFLTFAVVERPQLLEVAELAGIDMLKVEEARARIGADRRRAATISTTFMELLRSVDSRDVK
jgi:hypothetical protein